MARGWFLGRISGNRDGKIYTYRPYSQYAGGKERGRGGSIACTHGSLQFLCALQAVWPDAVVNFPATHAAQRVSAEAWPFATRYSPAVQLAWAPHAAWLASSENVPVGQVMQRASRKGVPTRVRYSPGGQLTCASQATWSVEVVNLPAAHAAQAALALPVPALVRRVPAAQAVCVEHDAWSALAEYVPIVQSSHSLSSVDVPALVRNLPATHVVCGTHAGAFAKEKCPAGHALHIFRLCDGGSKFVVVENVPGPQSSHALSRTAVPTCLRRSPASHVACVAHGIVRPNAGLNDPAAQAVHTAFFVTVPGEDSNVPGGHTVCGLHRPWFTPEAYCPAAQSTLRGRRREGEGMEGGDGEEGGRTGRVGKAVKNQKRMTLEVRFPGAQLTAAVVGWGEYGSRGNTSGGYTSALCMCVCVSRETKNRRTICGSRCWCRWT